MDEYDLKIEKLKNYFGLKSISGVASVGIELLDWVMEQFEDGFEITANKEEGDKVIVKEIPIEKQ